MGIVISRIDDITCAVIYDWDGKIEYMTWLLLPCTIEKTVGIGIATSRIHDMTITAMNYWENFGYGNSYITIDEMPITAM